MLQNEDSDESNFLSNSSEDEELLIFIEEQNEDDSSDTSTESVKPRRNLHRIENYIDVVDRYDEAEFKENFRLKRSTCDYIIRKQPLDSVLTCIKNSFSLQKT